MDMVQIINTSKENYKSHSPCHVPHLTIPANDQLLVIESPAIMYQGSRFQTRKQEFKMERVSPCPKMK